MVVQVEKKIIRVLHVVGGMDAGGIETWLMHVLRRIDRDRYRFDFLTHTDKPCFYDDEIRSFGCRIISCLNTARPWPYARDFLRVLKESGPYDAVHSHVHHFSGFTLMLARLAGVPVRIAHSHTDTSLNEKRAGIRRQFYLRGTKWFIRCCSTTGLACSGLAAANLFGKNWECDPRWRVYYCGIDLDPFMKPVDRVEVRRELGIPLGAFVVGHVGRFTELKNHGFLLDVFAEFSQREKDACLLLVGDGALYGEIVEKTKRLGLTDKVIFAGIRPDVPRLMAGAMDVFVFTSFHEGLPLVLIEAQAAGLPMVVTDTITEEAFIIPQLAKPVSLKQDSAIWAKEILNSMNSRQPDHVSRQRVSASKFNIIHGIDELCRVYSKEGTS